MLFCFCFLDKSRVKIFDLWIRIDGAKQFGLHANDRIEESAVAIRIQLNDRDFLFLALFIDKMMHVNIQITLTRQV